MDISTDPADRRHRTIALTPTAAKQLATLGNALAFRFATRLDMSETEDIERFAGYIRRLLDDADKDVGACRSTVRDQCVVPAIGAVPSWIRLDHPVDQ